MLSEKIALVTGGGRGIGRAVALLLAQKKAHVIICSRSKDELSETVHMVSDNGGSADSVVCDIGNEDEVLGMFDSVNKEHGSLDILVNGAAIFASGLLENTSVEDFKKILDINCTASFLCCREAFRLMKGKGGSIVNISSLAGVRGVEKFPGFGAYIVSKFGVVGLTEALAVEGKEYGIRVNAICPGAVDTEMLQKAAPNLYPRLEPEQIANHILFLAGPESAGLSGSAIEVYSSLLKG